MKRRLRGWIGRGNWFAIGTLPGAILVGLLVTILSVLLIPLIFGSSQPSAEEQIAADVPPGYSVKSVRSLELRSAAETSYLVVLARPERERAKGKRPEAGLDEVRIYDKSGSDLTHSFTLHPDGLVPGRPTVKWHGIVWGNPAPRSYSFYLRATDDYDRDGRAEVIGVFRDQASEILRPVAIAWSARGDRYVASPLIPDRPVTPLYDSHHPVPGPAGWDQLEASRPLRAVTPGHRPIYLYGTSALEVAHLVDNGRVLITGGAVLTVSRGYDPSAIGKRRTPGGGLEFQLRTGFGRSPVVGRLAVDVWRLQFEDGRVRPTPCDVYGTSRIRPGLVVPRLVVSALPRSSLDPRRIRLGNRVYC